MLLAVSVVIYALLQAMPGDPIDMYLENPSATPEAIEAIKKHGPFKGVYLAIRRILRCHPWGGSGYDPVP